MISYFDLSDIVWLLSSLRAAVNIAPTSERSSASTPPAARHVLRASGPRSSNASALADGVAHPEAIDALSAAFSERVRPGGCAGPKLERRPPTAAAPAQRATIT